MKKIILFCCVLLIVSCKSKKAVVEKEATTENVILLKLTEAEIVKKKEPIIWEQDYWKPATFPDLTALALMKLRIRFGRMPQRKKFHQFAKKSIKETEGFWE